MKKYGALMLSSLLTVIGFFIGLTMFGFLYSFAFMGVSLILGTFLGSRLLTNPFTDMLEGKGILAANWDSTGIFRFFICGIKSPFISAKFDGETITDVFDRATITSMPPPIKVEEAAEFTQEGGLKITLTEEQYNRGRHVALHYPLIIWNNQIKSIITKDFISDTEKSVFAEHGILYLNRKIEELTTHVRDFGRYVVENLKPKSNWLTSKWAIIIIIIFVVILIVLFAPAFLNTFKSAAGAVTSTGSAVGSVVPK